MHVVCLGWPSLAQLAGKVYCVNRWRQHRLEPLFAWVDAEARSMPHCYSARP